MNKAQRIEIARAEVIARIDPAFSAASLAVLHRCASKKDQTAIAAKVAELGLSDRIQIINGCMVTK